MEPTKFDIKYAAIRRSIIEQQFAHLNERQQQAVFQTEGPLLILAGAGSGKTTVLTQRISHILRFGRGLASEYAPEGASEQDLLFLTDYLLEPSEQNRAQAERLCTMDRVRPWEIIAITFTNKAARELRERIVQAVGEDGGEVWAHTFHTACLRMLRKFGDLLGFSTAFTIYDEDDKKRVITGILKKMNLDPKAFEPRTIIGMISRAKDKLQTPKQFMADAGNEFFAQKVAEVYEQYEREMRRAAALDFDDIIMKTVLLLQKHSEMREYYQNKFRYVLVDEYQDTNYAQYMLASILAAQHENICVVGDDDQSIYKFRGATITNILEFEKRFRQAQVIRLEQNYRSTGNILSAANEVIRNNVGRKGKELWTSSEAGEKICLHRSSGQEEEAAYIAQTILEGVKDGRKWGDFAVLYRNNVLSDNILAAFVRNGIPYRVYKGRDFFSRAEIRDMFAYLWVIENPADELRLRRIINVPARKIGDKTVEAAAEIAAEQGLTLFSVVANAGEHAALSRSANALTAFGQMMMELQQQKEFLPPSELYELLLEKSGYKQVLEAKNDMESIGRLEHIEELKSYLVNYEKDNEQPTLGGFLEEMALYTDADQSAEDEDAVVMMTMHAAKGLEFPVVFVAGMEDGLFPSFRSAEREEDMEEERRLCYVALTRAKQRLYLTCAERRMLYGRTQFAHPSRFVEEIPENLLDSNVGKSRLQQAAEQVQRENSYVLGRAKPPQFSAKSKAPAPAIPLEQLKAGARLSHQTFGAGLIVSVKPMGGDALLEIAFDTQGTKRLMAKTAMKFLTLE